MPRARRRRWLFACLLAGAAVLAAPAGAQSTREAQRKLEKVNRELKAVAAERRQIEGRRGDASRQLREVDEKVGASTRSLRETEGELARQQAALADLRDKRDALQASLAGQRRELGELLRAAYAVGDDAPLKLMLSQDKVAEANRALAYHRYLQRERTARIGELTTELAELERIEREIAQRQSALDEAKVRQRAQLSELERDRKARSATVAQLDKRYQDRSAREKALGRDAKALGRLLEQLRIAAAKAEAERRAAAEAAARAKQGAPASGGHKPRPPPIEVAKTAPIQVGGLGWPVSGSLLAGYGGTMPDGRRSSGVLIGAPAGTTVRAVADGTVVFAEWMTGYGLILIIDHGNGYMSLYAHNDALLKDPGVQVKRGDPVASVGNSGGQGRPGLYFELRRNGAPVDPNTWLGKR
jgi:septal ring factor EnvC (AmiA/AmiB activator)